MARQSFASRHKSPIDNRLNLKSSLFVVAFRLGKFCFLSHSDEGETCIHVAADRVDLY